MTDSKFELEWNQICGGQSHDSFEYTTATSSILKTIRSHFSKRDRKHYGVYAVRSRSSTGGVLYVGKAGTVRRDGGFKGQDLPGRLMNVRGKESSKTWFSELCDKNGPLIIEYILLESTPISPALAESRLLQAFLNENGRLPCKNTSF
jgi:hypothetical protein